MILLSDTAQADLATASAYVHALLDRIEHSSELDHVLSAEKSDFELRYQSLDNTYVFFRREEQQVTIVYFCEMNVPAVLPSTEPKIRVLDKQIREIPNGMEAEVTLEKTTPDGTVSMHHHFVRKVDMGEHYMTIAHQPAGTMIVNGKRARSKATSATTNWSCCTLLHDGTVRRFPASVVPVLVRIPAHFDDRMVARSPQFEERMQIARKWLVSSAPRRSAGLSRIRMPSVRGERPVDLLRQYHPSQFMRHRHRRKLYE